MAQMSFLELVQRTYRESGIGGSIGPSSVGGQNGRNADFVKWVQTAFEEIQNLRDNWNFAWASSEAVPFNLTAAKDSYSPVDDFDIAGGVAEWSREGAYVFRPADGPMSRHWLGYREWELFRELVIPVVPGMPTLFSVQPDGRVRYYPRPEQAYKAVHEYYRIPQALSVDGDVPRLPPRFHMAIVWNAVMKYAEFNKDWSLMDSAKGKYDEIMDAVFAKETPGWTHAGTMA